MNILYVTYTLNALLMIVFGIAAGAILTQQLKLGWRLYLIGAATFVISQLFHLPFNSLILNPFLRTQVIPNLDGVSETLAIAVLGGLSAGLFEEFTRYGVLRWWARKARTWPQGLLFGAGHGGAEAILLGVLVAISLINMIVLKDADLPALVPPEQLDQVHELVQAYWSTPWHTTLLGALERALTIPLQISFAVLVLQAFTRGRFRWVWLAVLWHTFIDAAAVFASQYWNVYAAEFLLAVMSAIGIAVILALRGPGPVDQAEDGGPIEPISPIQIQPCLLYTSPSPRD